MVNPVSLAVDWVVFRIYILIANENLIVSTDLNGERQVTIMASGPQPADIVLEPSLRRMFWSTLDGGIFAASMDGTDKQVLVSRGIEWASGLAIDYPVQRLYWADSRKGTVESVQLNGKGRHIITEFKTRGKNAILTTNKHL